MLIKKGSYMNYKKRMSCLREKLAQKNLEGILVPLDASCEYLTGVPRLSSGNTKQRQVGSDYGCLVITHSEAAVFMADLNLLVTLTKLGTSKPDVEFYEYCNGDFEAKVLFDYFDKKGLNGKSFGIMSDVPSAVTTRLIKEKSIKAENADDIVFAMRSIKDEQELALMQTASDITDKIYYDLLKEIKVGANVQELEFLIEKLIVKHGASKNSFNGELNCFGPKAGCMVGDGHHTIEKGYVLGLDMGVYYKGYCSDFGRTIFIGEPTKEHRKIYDIVMDSYNRSIALVKSGTTCHEVDAMSRQVMAQAGYQEHYIHKLGHGIGMDVHEHPLLTANNKAKIENNMVFAVEPSIFLPHNCFIRTEDMVLVTENGAKQFSAVGHEITIIE